MIIFPEVLGEAELSVFEEKDFNSLSQVLDDTLAKYIKNYIENPEANQDVVKRIQDNIGDLVTSLTLHQVLQDKGIVSLVLSLSPENLLSSGADLRDIKEKLQFLEKYVDKVRTTIAPRSKSAYTDFVVTMRGVVNRMSSLGIPTTFNDVIKRIESNKFMFYIPNDKGHTTGVNIINSKRRQWTLCLRGLEYYEYCEEHGIDYVKRRLF